MALTSIKFALRKLRQQQETMDSKDSKRTIAKFNLRFNVTAKLAKSEDGAVRIRAKVETAHNKEDATGSPTAAETA